MNRPMISKWRVNAMLSYLQIHLEKGDMSHQKMIEIIKSYKDFVDNIDEEKEQEEMRLHGYN